MNLSALSPSEQAELIQRLEAREKYQAASAEEQRRIRYRATLEADFAQFVAAAWHVIRPGQQLKWSWHYDLIGEYLTLVYRREIRRLIINISPRTLKSILVTVMFPVWVWTKQATHNFACASYSGELSTEHSVMRRTIIESDWFRGIWGDRIWLAADQNQKTKYKNNHEAQMIATSVGGTATGLGGDTLILDDGLNPKQASSEAERKTATTWFDETWRTRLNDQSTGALVVVEQRTNERDVSGHLLATNRAEWTHLCLPLEAETQERWVFPVSGRVIEREVGEVLQPDRFPPEVIEALKRLRLVWAGQYQQHPAPLEGNMIKWSEIRYYGGVNPVTQEADDPLPEKFDLVLISADCAFKDLKTSDYVAVGAIGIKGRKRYILEVINAHLDEPGTAAAIERMRLNYRAHVVLVEDKANGPAIIKALRQKNPGIIAVDPQGGKIARMFAVCGEWQAGDWYVDRNAAWSFPFCDQITKFPNAANDDMADMMSQAGIYIQANSLRYGLLDYYKSLENAVTQKREEIVAKANQAAPAAAQETLRASEVTPAEPADEAAKAVPTEEVAKVDVPPNVMRCPTCSSVLVQRVAGGYRCGQCGTQWGQTKPAPHASQTFRK